MGDTVNLSTERDPRRYYAALYRRDPTKGALSFAEWFNQHLTLIAWRPRRTGLTAAVQRAHRIGLYAPR